MAEQSKVAVDENQLLEYILSIYKSLTQSNSRKVMTLASVFGILLMIKKINNRKQFDSPSKSGGSPIAGPKKGGKGNVDKAFFNRIFQLIKIVVPTWKDSAIFDIVLLTFFLVSRTYLSIFISGANARIVKAIIKQSWPLFLKRIVQLAMMAIPASFVNSELDYLNRRLACTFRSRLTKYFSDLYLKEMVFYQITNLDQRVGNPDQRLTDDIEKWANSLSQIYSNFTKPLLDIILFSKKLSDAVGILGLSMVLSWNVLSGYIIKFISPPFGKLIAQQQRLEGKYRSCHSDLSHHSEEIAFYKGNKWERERIKGVYKSLKDHTSSIVYKRLFMGLFDNLQTKYGAIMVGYTIVGLPVFGPGKEDYLKRVGDDTSAITRDYVRNSNLLINLSKAVGRLVISYKEIQQLAGYTTLVSEMQDVLKELNAGKYQRQLVGEVVTEFGYRKGQTQTVCMGKEKIYTTENSIKFDEIPIITPSGDYLVQKISFEVKPGDNVIVTGPNGCGKSSLFRILGGLWPIFTGKLGRPERSKMFYVPQRPYLPPGTLRDQIIYPDNKLQMLRKKVTDAYLRELLQKVNLGYLEGRESQGFDTVQEWKDVFSGGERQRIAMARMFYHKPTFAVLDECTSAVSIDVENNLYSTAKQFGITLFTVSHRHSLFKHHDYILRFDEKQGWDFKKYDQSEDQPAIKSEEYTNEQLYGTKDTTRN
ncbi:P-loop containing nucleoside triphosphate hydrolase [Pseudocohnilembus persalinus]|uniref:p-loop containing nucleoside triphosphate hydrolase n=1 Tax=Pseudocohnilembus persalinus TaxID=266149 RepID=A0A0V0R7N4_PSEPJ|nr:P-loop containing nucleoside triphosphate hydrolase [Pseudocohnilembus persalinus]|eukprot:KRX10502.1 P-loop containing nucleoside triphosphate hydrolase [Pseudocohnilembus persalinus]